MTKMRRIESDRGDVPEPLLNLGAWYEEGKIYEAFAGSMLVGNRPLRFLCFRKVHGEQLTQDVAIEERQKQLVTPARLVPCPLIINRLLRR
jgi:hypothetical protein